MHEYKWHLPRSGENQVVLQLSSSGSWFARKRLTVDGRNIYRRGLLSGIDVRFQLPGAPPNHYRLINEPFPDSANWRPALYENGERVPELTALLPEPTIHRRPRELSLVVGLTLLCMFVCTTSFSSIAGLIEWYDKGGGYPTMGKWLSTFLVTAPCLAGYWDMRRWGPILLGCGLIAEIVFRVMGWIEFPVMAMVLQSALVAFGFAYYKKMY